MFERYTEKARRVIFFARYEASQFGSPYIESEFLLLGLLREDKELTTRLLHQRASVDAIRRQIEQHTTVREKLTTSVDLPLANDCKRILAFAAEEAMRLEHKHIGTEHLLLGILREEQCFAAQLLTERGFTLAVVRKHLQAAPAPEVLRAASVTRTPTPQPTSSPATPPLVFALAGGEVLLRYQNLPLPVPRIGETIVLGPPGEPARRYRVENVTWTFVAPPPEPEAVAAARQRIDRVMAQIENFIANHEFEKARLASDEERKERDTLREMLAAMGPKVRSDAADNLPPPLDEVRITLLHEDEPTA